MKKMIQNIFLLLLLLSYLGAYGQEEQQTGSTTDDSLQIEQKKSQELNERYLALEKPSGKKRLRFYKGDELYFRLKNTSVRYSSIIQDVNENSIHVLGTDIPLKDIASITIYNRSGMLRQLTTKLPIAGVGYFLMDMLNPLVSGGEGFVVTKSTVLISGSAVLIGVALNIFKKRTFKLNQNKYLITLQKF